MRIEVALLPGLLPERPTDVCVVVDALRATSAIATMFAHGVEAVAVVGAIDEARALKAAAPVGALLCSESGGLPPEGFDHGNSPAEFADMDLGGRRAILATSNGTRALVRAAAAPAVFTGSLLNRAAAAQAAHEAATALAVGVAIVCSGTDLARAFSLEDLAVSGALVEELLRRQPDAHLTDGAMAALRLWRSYAEPRAIFDEAAHARTLVGLGLAADLEFCAQVDRYTVAPKLEMEDELLVLRAQI